MFRWKISLYLIISMAISGGEVFAATYPGQLGVGVTTGEASGSFVDMAKEHHRWSRLPSGTMAYDSEGWPACDTQLIMDFRLVAEWEGFIDDPEEYRYDNRGTYKCSFAGQATLAAAGASIANKTYDAGTNTTTFALSITQKRVYAHLNFTNTKRTAASATDTGFTDLKMIRPGYPADTNQLFHTPLLEALGSANFAAMRFMGFTASNAENVTYPDTTTWAERKLPTDAAQVSMEAAGKWESGCWEYVIALANATMIDPWINVPVSATTDYVTQLATMLRDNLHPSLNVYVESSNEVWNGIFPQQAWNAAQASALGINEHENHARRTVELAQIFEGVFGGGSLNDRVRVMLCCHAPMLKWWVENYMIAYINSTYLGSAKDYIYAIARQTYFGGASATGQAGTETYTVTQILDECHSNITGQMSEPSGNEAGRLQWVQKAAAWQLVGGACSYEGGTDFMGTDYSDYPDSLLRNIDNRITAVRSARMKDELKYNYDDAFFALGGNLAVDLALSSSYARWGCWGLTDDVTNPDRNYQFEAARELLGYETGDLDENSRVNTVDLGIFCQQWLDTGGCSDPNCADLDGSLKVDFADFAMLAENWGR